MKYALVTGAGGGMGQSTAALLQAKGYHVFAVDQAAGESTEFCTWLQTDITDEESVLQAFSAVSKVTDRLDVILHFAGIYMLDSLVELENKDFEKIFAVNVQGAFLVNRTFLPLLGQDSRILMTTSELAPLDPLPFTGIYAVTKAALDKYAYSLRMELQLLGIHVSVLRAGAVSTNMLGVSTTALDRFCKETKRYCCNAARFKRIVDKVEARNISTEKLASKVGKILAKKHPRFAYHINRNPLLLLLNLLPKGLQLWIIKQILR